MIDGRRGSTSDVLRRILIAGAAVAALSAARTDETARTTASKDDGDGNIVIKSSASRNRPGYPG